MYYSEIGGRLQTAAADRKPQQQLAASLLQTQRDALLEVTF
jgi:hypothetical protein